MQINLFYYLVTNLLFLQLLSLEVEVIHIVLTAICGVGIATLGIAHGAIDDHLSGVGFGKKRITFIIYYVLALCLFAFIWYVKSEIALILFLVTSSFHFGQTQLVNIKIKSRFFSWFFNFSWGSLVISALIFLNKDSLSVIDNDYFLFPSSFKYLTIYSSYYFATSLIFVFVVFLILFWKNYASLNILFKEIYLLVIIGCSFYIMDPFIAFALFFVIIHALKAMTQEYAFCKNKKIATSYKDFFKLFFPLTLISLFMVFAMTFAMYYFDYLHLLPYLLLIFLSCITIPHSFVMDRFYGSNKNIINSIP